VFSILEEPSIGLADALKAILGDIGPPESYDRRHIPSADLVSRIGDSLKVPPTAVEDLENTALKTQALAIADFLSDDTEGVRLCVLTSPPASGRKIVMRYFVQTLDKEMLKLGRGRLPVLAEALDEIPPDEFVDKVLRFYYRDAGAFQHADIDTKLNLIRSKARTEPAAICVSDLPPAYTGGIIRGAAQDFTGDVLFALIEGHPLTRVFVTTTQAQTALFDEIRARGVIVRDEKVNPTVKLSLPDEVEVPRLNARLFGVAQFLIDAQVPAQEQGLNRNRAKQSLEDASKLIDLTFNQLLNEAQQRIVGLCACSAEGLSLRDLRRMIDVAVRHEPDFWSEPPPDEAAIAEIVKQLGKLVQTRRSAEHIGLGPPVDYIILDDGWRRDFLRLYCAKHRKHAGLAHWLLARLFAEQSRTLRMSGNRGVVAARDMGKTLSTIKALMASVRAHEIEPWAHPELPIANLESVVLPPLDDRDALRPDSTLLLRYAYAQLVRRDALSRTTVAVNLGDHADRQLETLLALFHPYDPWKRWEELELSSAPGTTLPLQMALTSRELAALLSDLAEAALKCRRFDIVAAAARNAEQVKSDNDDLLQSELIRVHRAEVDAGLLAGAMPADVLNKTGAQVFGVTDAIRDLIEKRFALAENPHENCVRALGKLHGRLAESHFITGDIKAAAACLDDVAAVEQILIQRTPPAQELFPVQSSRGARGKLRLLLYRAMDDRWVVARRVTSPQGVQLPLPVSPDPETLRLARDVHYANVRRIHTRGVSERLASHIDEALLKSAHGDYGGALNVLDVSGSAWHGVSMEVALELAAVRLRLTFDALLLSQDNPAILTQCEEYAHTRRGRLGGMPHGSSPDILAAAARSDAQAMRRFSGRAGAAQKFELAPFYIHALLMQAWALLLSAPAGELVLPEAAELVSSAIRRMEETGCRLHLPEAEMLKNAIEAVAAA
jgi:hypothetical protein